MSRASKAGVGDDYSIRGNPEPAIVSHICAEQVLAARVCDLEEILTCGQSSGASRGVRAGAAIKVNVALGSILHIGVDNRAVYDCRENGAGQGPLRLHLGEQQ